MQIPTDKEIRSLHERYAPTREAFDLVYTHSEIVCGVAEQLLVHNGLNLDADLVRAGSLLHDIGVYLLYSYSTAGKLDHTHYILMAYSVTNSLPDRGSQTHSAGSARATRAWA